MIGDVGIIGLCILKMKNEARCSLAEKINNAVIRNGFKLVWFTYFEETNCIPEVNATFGMLDKSFIDAMIVCNDESDPNQIGENIVSQAVATGIPVLCMGNVSGGTLNYNRSGSDSMVDEAIAALADKLPHIERLSEEKLDAVENDVSECFTPEDISLGEDMIYSHINRMLEVKSVKELVPSIAGILPKNSYFCFSGEFLKQYDDPDWDDEKFKIIPAAGTSIYDTMALSRTKVIPESYKWLLSRDCFILTPAISKDVICGYYAYRIHNMDFFKYRCRSVARFLNIALNVFVKNMQNKRILRNMEGYLFLDMNTGLPNLKGVTRWFKETAAKQENHEKRFVFTVFSLPKYNYIYENYGTETIEDALRIVAARLQIVYDQSGYIARVQSDEFVVINSYDPEVDALAESRKKIRRFYEELQKYHRRNLLEYYIDVNSGSAVADPGWSGTLELFVKYAASDMYLHSLNQENGKLDNNDDLQKDTYSAFDSLVKNNLINYHFQPIIDAKTGDIFGYEALMRSGGGISLSPLEILDIAKNHGRLDDVERITLYNILRIFKNNLNMLQDRKLFINTIPGHFLKPSDRSKLKESYGDCLDKVVFEVTEQDSITDEELASIRGMSSGDTDSQIAVDDYGAGHSNIVNLLRYSPQVIKIDRYLISDIQNDTNKQMFVKSTIEFASMNNIKVLAEGVETFEELQTVLEYGVDLIQGYYVARPNPEFLDRIPEKIRQEVLNENLRLSAFDRELKVYKAKNGENINLIGLAMKQYTYIDLGSGKYFISGDKNSAVDMHIRTTDESVVELVINDVNVRGATETPLMLGKNSTLKLEVCGYNTLNKEGILVPESSSLTVMGEGTLSIALSRNYGVGIGGGYKGAYGNITIDMKGCIDMNGSGDRVVCIGGEKSDGAINFISGRVVINGTGISILDVGSVDGEAQIYVHPYADLDLFSNGNDSVAIGSIKAKANVSIRGKVKAESNGERTVAIGSLFGDNSSVIFEGGNVNASIHCDSGSVIGSYNCASKVNFTNTTLDIYGEGGRVTGIGSVNGCCKAKAESGEVRVKVLSGLASILGSRNDTIEAAEGVITIIENEE